MACAGIAELVVVRHLAASGETFAEFGAVRCRQQEQARTLVLAMVPAFAIVVGLLALGRRRVNGVQHLVFSLHTYTFLFLALALSVHLTFAGVRYIWLPLGGPWRNQWTENVLSTFVFGGVGVYLLLSLRRAYGFGWVRTLVTATVLSGMTFFILIQYRRVLFLVTMWSMAIAAEACVTCGHEIDTLSRCAAQKRASDRRSLWVHQGSRRRGGRELRRPRRSHVQDVMCRAS